METIKYIKLVFATLLILTGFASCANDDELSQVSPVSLDLAVTPFPAFTESASTRAIGTQDAGKTVWKSGDEILVKVTLYSDANSSVAVGSSQTLKYTFNGTSWIGDKSLLSSQYNVKNMKFETYYAPCYQWNANGELELKSGKYAGQDEFLTKTITQALSGTSATVNIDFSTVTRNYSRLRIASSYGNTVNLKCATFTPVHTTAALGASGSIPVKADENDNAFFYGTWTANSTITINSVTDDASAEDKSVDLTKSTVAASTVGSGSAVDLQKLIHNGVGKGTEASPYLIYNAVQLKDLAVKQKGKKVVGGHYYRLENDVNLNTVCSATLGSWTPIGIKEQTLDGDIVYQTYSPFNCYFDGGGYVISNLYINTPGESNVGLFGYISSGKVKNLITSGSVTGYIGVGGIVGGSEYTDVSGCSNNCTLTGYGNVGGLVGQQFGGMISGCINTGSINYSSYANRTFGGNFGGISGNVSQASIVGCLNNVTSINGHYNTGGITGNIYGSTITGCLSYCPTFNALSPIGVITGISAGYAPTLTVISSFRYVSGNIQLQVGQDGGGTSVQDVSSVSNLNDATVVSAMNTAITTWNTNNASTPCKYNFAVATGTAKVPVIVKLP